MDSITIKLIKSEYGLNGRCVYEDDYGNRLHMFKKEHPTDNVMEFTAKLRFKDNMVKADVIKVSLPVKEGEGANLHINYLDGIDKTESAEIQSAVNMATTIIQRWIAMLSDIAMLKLSPKFARELNPSLSDEEIAKMKIKNLMEYEELSDIVGGVMATSGSFISHT